MTAAQDASQRGKRREDQPVFEQCENLDNPLRCPVKLYEFYLSKWLVGLIRCSISVHCVSCDKARGSFVVRPTVFTII